MALVTPPHFLNLTRAEPAAIEALAEAVRRGGPPLPGVMGPAEAARNFAECWSGRSACASRPGHGMRLYQLTQVLPPAARSGRLVAAGPADFDLARQWEDAFCRQIAMPPMSDEVLRRRLAGGNRFFWLDPQPVSMAAVSGVTPTGARIGGVYTPPQNRRRGYATALVAAVSQRQLDAGRRHCCLFTDLSNPTANKIYQSIGYRPVCDFQTYDFAPAQRASH